MMVHFLNCCCSQVKAQRERKAKLQKLNRALGTHSHHLFSNFSVDAKFHVVTIPHDRGAGPWQGKCELLLKNWVHSLGTRHMSLFQNPKKTISHSKF